MKKIMLLRPLTPTLIFLTALLTLGMLAHADAEDFTSAENLSAPDEAAASCVEVEVNGVRAPSYACLTQKLRAAKPGPNPNPLPGLASEQILNRPGNQLGLFNRAATSNRMGNTFGTSVYPQRPPAPIPGSPYITPQR